MYGFWIVRYCGIVRFALLLHASCINDCEPLCVNRYNFCLDCWTTCQSDCQSIIFHLETSDIQLYRKAAYHI